MAAMDSALLASPPSASAVGVDFSGGITNTERPKGKWRVIGLLNLPPSPQHSFIYMPTEDLGSGELGS